MSYPAINSIVRQIDARNIERTIRQLVAFGTRNTLSEQNDPKRGIGAARDWLYAEFLKAAETSGGRMTVEKQSYEQPKAARVLNDRQAMREVTLQGEHAGWQGSHEVIESSRIGGTRSLTLHGG